MKYFQNNATGLNADIERHRNKREELIKRIEEIENKEIKSEMDLACLRVYQDFRCSVEQSLAEVLNKLGRRKRK